MTIGTRGAWLATARCIGPSLKGPSSPVRERVPSGAMTTDRRSRVMRAAARLSEAAARRAVAAVEEDEVEEVDDPADDRDADELTLGDRDAAVGERRPGR
jgi:hypothetical protein